MGTHVIGAVGSACVIATFAAKLLVTAPTVMAVQSEAAIQFRNVAAASGIRFTLQNSPTASKYLVETMAGGIAAFDYDGDGRVDLYFTNGASLPALTKDSPKYHNRLFHNLGGMQFEDVTASAGLAGAGYSIGAIAADYDNDGKTDLFVAGVGQNTLYHNRGDGTFQDVTTKANITSAEWSVGGAWLDYDNDGFLDLFVVNYVKWTPENDRFCGSAERNLRVYCHPRLFQGSANRLYRNQHNGTFKDVSVQTGIASQIGKGMAAAVADYDQDGYLDIYVTNDKLSNFLFHNVRGQRFEEVALLAGVALPDSGNAGSSMGVDFRDYDNDGLPDIVLTALSGETFPVFHNAGGGLFLDAGESTHLASASRVYSGWGIGMYDLNNDGWKDIFTANSHVNDLVESFEATRYKQHNSIFRNLGKGMFQDASPSAGPDFQSPRAHRGSSIADLDGDGKLDIVVSELGGVPELWKNVSADNNNWLIVKLVGTLSNRDGIGTEIRVGEQVNQMTTSVGYASSSSFGVHFGTGKQKQVQVDLRWPSGVRQTLQAVPTNQVLTVREPSK